MTEATADTLVADTSATTTYRALWLAVAFDLLAFGVGFAADRRWHTTHPFEDFSRRRSAPPASPSAPSRCSSAS